MKVYLDNNVLVDIETGKYQLDSFLSKPLAEYYYSEVHMDELMNGLEKHPELKVIRLKTLERLCGLNYILPGVFDSGIEMNNRTPQSAFELSMQFKFLHDHLYQYTNSMNFDRDTILESLKLEKKEVGNYKADEILHVIEEKMVANWGYGIATYLEMQVASFDRTKYNALFNLLDFVCYWKDSSHTARLYDASHAYFAECCDVLVTNDKRMKYKTEAVYSYLGKDTRVMKADVFLSTISEK